jgi:hypothetical protein
LSAGTPRSSGILNSSLDKGRCQLHAYVRLAKLSGYTSELRSFTIDTTTWHSRDDDPHGDELGQVLA